MIYINYVNEFNRRNNYSEIIDVRSEDEFIEDHIPGAINLPVLNNRERSEVGTIYKQISSFEARKLGASLIAKNISNHLKNHFLDKDKTYSPLIYCWRGGQRSNSLATVLSQIGWQVHVLKGGYKTYRKYVRHQLEILPLKFDYSILCGLTGTGKTFLLQKLASKGNQVLDLEKIANHRGSLLGQERLGILDTQPSQKRFDSLLLQQLKIFDLSKTIWVESESYKIGEVYLPSNLWQKMKQARCFEVKLTLSERVEFLLQEYSHFTTHPNILKNKLNHLKPRYGASKIDQWFRWIDQKQWFSLVEDLLIIHYDPAYQKSLKKTYDNFEKIVPFTNLDDETIDNILDKLLS